VFYGAIATSYVLADSLAAAAESVGGNAVRLGFLLGDAPAGGIAPLLDDDIGAVLATRQCCTLRRA